MAFVTFWRTCPALLAGAFALLGSAFSLTAHPAFLFPLLLLEVAAITTYKKRAVIHNLLFVLTLLYTDNCKPLLLPSQKALATIVITEKKLSTTPFDQRLFCRAELLSLDDTPLKKKIPCSFSLPLSSAPDASFSYRVPVTIEQKKRYRTHLKIAKSAKWEKLQQSSALPELRYRAKHTLRKFLNVKISSPSASKLLSALLTGEIEEILLSYRFGKVGLQHLLAISGFHFALIAFLLYFLCSFLFPKRLLYVFLLFPLTFYFLFLGPSPSILRAYIAICTFLIGRFCRFPISPINSLGLALLFEIVLDPLSISFASFQLSFFATLSILLLYSPFERLLIPFFPSRSAAELLDETPLYQHLYPLRIYLHKTLALNFAVFFPTAPLLLIWFHKIPLLSLVYNLLIPLLTTVSLSVTLIALLPIPLLSPLLFSFSSSFTSLWLDLLRHPPALLDFHLRFASFPLSIAIPLISSLLLIAAAVHIRQPTHYQIFDKNDQVRYKLTPRGDRSSVG